MDEPAHVSLPPFAWRPLLAVASVYTVAIAGLLWIDALYASGRPQLTPFVLMRLLFLVTAAVGLLALGRDSISAVFGHLSEPWWLAIGPVLGALGCGVSIAWVRLTGMDRLLPVAYVPRQLSIYSLLISPLLVAYTEELVFRGVLWAALLRLSRSPLRPLLQTSVVFALLHLINAVDGHQWLELPHRFLGGLILGLIRWRSGSLMPCVHAHFIWLVLANAA